ncbi:MAG TPA: lantibiotic dehydratase [Actinomycetes bacterium]|jgi:thiopeptide-type bacteriocin biosynthesis protein|nr:lantibiotic dehydratase [Actinomycetes bacterium]
MTERDKDSQQFTPSGFFVLRTPLLPFEEMAAWSEGLEAVGSLGDPQRLEAALERDRDRLRARLLALVARPEVREAIFVASPSLDEALDVWQKEPDSKRGRKLEPAVVSYVSRAAARATPFGLFAGYTTGTIDTQTRLHLQALDRYQPHSRLDMDYLWALAEAVERDPQLRRALMYEPNSSLYEVAGRLRLAEARLTATGRSYHLVAVDKSPYLTAALERAQGGAPLEAVAGVLVDDEISQAEAEEYVAELVDNQLLMTDARPLVTGDEPVHGLVAVLGGDAGTARIAERVDEARAALEAIDAEGLGTSPDRYRAVASPLGELPAQPELSRLVQVDMVKPAQQATLGSRVVSELARGARILHQLAPPQEPEGLARFREEFFQRYETREVPLVEALDEEIGIGFERSNSPLAEASPLLGGLPFRGSDPEAKRWTARDVLLLGKLAQALAEGASEIALEASDLEALASEQRPPLPDAFYVMATVAAESDRAIAQGAFRVFLQHLYGPSGAVLLGRFCHADQTLLQSVRAHLRAEEARRPGRVFAEIVHLPEGRIGNILCRPVLRDYEIPYLGRSGAPADRQIPVTDLLVSVRDGRIVLRSDRLGREVVPRLTNAHNYTWRSLGVYRFLCALQHQDTTAGLVAWDWGPLQDAPFLPRVVSGRLVLCRAHWNVTEAELRALGQTRGADQFAAVQAWRAERQLPRYVALADLDNELVIDLDNVLSVAALAHQLRGRRQAVLVEMFPDPDALCVTGPEGRFVHELVVPFVQAAPPRPEPNNAATQVTRSLVRRRFPPGSEWLYAKLYTGAGTADRVLNHLVGPLVRSSLASGAADAWFFIRFADPDWHLRLRLHGESGRLHAEVLPSLEAAAARLLEAGQLWRMQLDTYEREVERYGGDRGIELAERVFAADSEAVLTIMGSLRGDAGLDLRWRLAMCGIDRLFDDLGLTLEEKRSVARRARESFGREFGIDGNFRGRVSQRYRAERARLEALLDPGQAPPAPLAAGLEALRRRSLQLAPVTAELRQLGRAGRLSATMTDIAMSYAHMHVNRLLRSAQRAQELVLYELLDRAYSAQAGRRSVSP